MAPLVRPAGPDDLETICSIVAERGDPSDGIDLRLIAEDVGYDGIAVAEVDGTVAATATLLDEELVVGALGSVRLPAGQVELVAADRRFEHRGLVRALMEWCHERSSARGHLVQVMIGIPNFYRQFGYSYGVPMHAWAEVATLPDPVPDVQVRRAELDDIDAMARLQEATQSAFGVRMPHQPSCWRALVRRDASTQWLAQRHGEAVGVARSVDDDGTVWIGEIASSDADATAALVRTAARAASDTPDGGPRGVRASDRAHVPGLSALLGVRERPDWFYVRIPDPVALMEDLRPVLSERLRLALPGAEGDALVSLWRSHLRFAYGPEGVGPMRAGGPFQSPVSAGGSGLPGDALPALLFGCGAEGLEQRYADAHLGRQADLMTALFPPQEADLLTFYLPC
ncbi:MAG: GNAT family N-acetyltransferase [Actinomycetes bacterium]